MTSILRPVCLSRACTSGIFSISSSTETECSRSSSCRISGSHVDHRGVVRIRERQTVELVHVAHVLRALRERDDVAARGLDAIALLDRAEGTEGVEHLMRHRLQRSAFAMQAVLANVVEGARMHHRMLAELHFDHVEAEGLGLPDEVLAAGHQAARLSPASASERCHHGEIREEVVAVGGT